MPRTTHTTTIAMMMTRIAAITGTIRLRCDRIILSVCSVVREPPPTSRAGAIVPEMQASYYNVWVWTLKSTNKKAMHFRYECVIKIFYCKFTAKNLKINLKKLTYRLSW